MTRNRAIKAVRGAQRVAGIDQGVHVLRPTFLAPGDEGRACEGHSILSRVGERAMRNAERLRGLQKGRLDGCRHVDGDETTSRKQIVLAALVDNAKVPLALGVLVGNDDVDLVALERCLVPGIVDADSEVASRHGLSSSSRRTACA
jgi:hypothetical protein